MALTWLITRPLEDALPMVEALSAKGVAARAVPCIERVALPWPAWADQQPGTARVVMITSGAVVPRLAQRRAELAGVTLAALAPATASKLRAAGLTVGLEAEGGVRELAAAVARWAEGRRLEVLYPTSDAAERQAEHREALAALSEVATVRAVPVYSTRPAPGLAAALAAAPRPFGLFLASPSAVEACVAATKEQGARFAPSAAVLHGASTLRAWKQYAPAHWPTPVPYDRTQELAATLLTTGATP